MGRWKFDFDAVAASEAMQNWHDRAAHNRHEKGHGFLLAMPEEISVDG